MAGLDCKQDVAFRVPMPLQEARHPRFRTMTALSQGRTPGPESSINKLVLAPKLLLDGGSRFVNYSEQYLPAPPFEFSLKNEQLECVQNEDFTLELLLIGDEVPDEVFLEQGQ